MRDCCHYDEGYQDGLEAANGDEAAVSDALCALSREYARAGDWERSEFAREFASVLARRSVETLAEVERKREAELVTLYRGSSAA